MNTAISRAQAEETFEAILKMSKQVNAIALAISKQSDPPKLAIRELRQPRYMVRTPEYIFISDYGHKCVFCFRHDLSFVRTIGEEAGLSQPRGLVFANGLLFVADNHRPPAASRICVFNLDGTLRTRRFVDPRPSGLAIAAGLLFVTFATPRNNVNLIRGYSLDCQLELRISFGSQTEIGGRLNIPFCLTASEDLLYVTSKKPKEVVMDGEQPSVVTIFNVAGECVSMWECAGMKEPTCIAVDGPKVLVVDREDRSVSVRNSLGECLGKVKFDEWEFKFPRPYSIAVEGDFVYIVDEVKTDVVSIPRKIFYDSVKRR